MPPTLNSVPLWALFANTPWWVYAIFAALLVIGLMATRPRRVALWRMMITPVVFLIWGVIAVALRQSLPLFAVWAVAFAAMGAVALATVRFALSLDAEGNALLPGSWWTLVRVMAVFVTKYVVAILIVFEPASRAQWVLLDVVVSGLSAGYFVGWGSAFVRAYLHARRGSVVTAVAA